MKSDLPKTVKEFHHWLRSNLARLQSEYLKNGDTILLDEGKELIKPLTEFNQYAHPKTKYQKSSYEVDETILVTTKNLPKNHGFESDEVEFKVNRYQPCVKDRF